MRQEYLIISVPKCGESPSDIEPLDAVMVMITCINGHTYNTSGGMILCYTVNMAQKIPIGSVLACLIEQW